MQCHHLDAPLGGLGPVAVHQAARPLAADDALRGFEETLEAGRVDLAARQRQRRLAGRRLNLIVFALCAGRHQVVLRWVSVSRGEQVLRGGGADGRGVEPLEVTGRVRSGRREVGHPQRLDASAGGGLLAGGGGRAGRLRGDLREKSEKRLSRASRFVASVSVVLTDLMVLTAPRFGNLYTS